MLGETFLPQDPTCDFNFSFTCILVHNLHITSLSGLYTFKLPIYTDSFSVCHIEHLTCTAVSGAAGGHHCSPILLPVLLAVHIAAYK